MVCLAAHLNTQRTYTYRCINHVYIHVDNHTYVRTQLLKHIHGVYHVLIHVCR